MIVLLPLSIFLWDMHIEKSQIRDNDFFKYDLTELYGGKQAKLFFDEYAVLRSYKDIKFYYRDSGRQISTLYSSWTVFVLDVYYEEDCFLEIVNRILADTELPEEYNYNGEEYYEYIVSHFDPSSQDNFVGWQILKDEPLYKNNVAGFFVDIKHHTIRYCFIYNEKNGNVTFFDTMVMLSIDLPWNREYRENDWAFNYPNS